LNLRLNTIETHSTLSDAFSSKDSCTDRLLRLVGAGRGPHDSSQECSRRGGHRGNRCAQALEEKRNLLSEQVIHGSNAGMRNELETELRAVQSALRFYPDALETERRFWASAPGG
jgi:hypothetical protein